MAIYDNPLIRRTLLMGLAGALALLSIVVASLWLAARTNRQSLDVVSARDFRGATGVLLSLLQDAETGQRGFLLTGEKEYLAPYEAARAQVSAPLEKMKKAAEDNPHLVYTVNRLVSLTNDKFTELATTINLAFSGRREEAIALVQSDRGREDMDEIRRLLAPLMNESSALITTRVGEISFNTSALIWISASLSLLVLALTAAAAWTVTNYTRELVSARRSVEETNLSLEGRVSERTAELVRANEEIQRFAYIVSHDLRAPLVNIVGFTSELEASMQTLQRFFAKDTPLPLDPALEEEAKTAATEDLAEAVGFIRASTTKMDRLINAVLKLSREGRRELNPEDIDLNSLFAAAAASVQYQLVDNNAELKIAANLPHIVTDRLALDQIFGNLIDNAIKYLSADRPGLIEIAASEERGRVSIIVSDNGRGIAPGDHDRVFELFRRAGAQDRAGEGIGLAHVKALVRRLGGDISVDSELARGTRFTVVLPKAIRRTSMLSGV